MTHLQIIIDNIGRSIFPGLENEVKREFLTEMLWQFAAEIRRSAIES